MNFLAVLTLAADLSGLSIDVDAISQGMEMVHDAIVIMANAESKRRAHEERLKKSGIAEEPASSAAVRYVVDTHGLGKLMFDDWGELHIDRRFITEEELNRVKEIELFVWRHVIEPLRGAKILALEGEGERPEKKPVKRRPRHRASECGLPVFRGFEDARYQQHDALIAKLVADFNANKAEWCGGSREQAEKIEDITPALVKSHMIEESGGGGPRSRAAWAVDPLQVNVPGDWAEEKLLVGLTKPEKRNEGSIEGNIRAAIKYLSRKGFGASGKPALERPKGFFDGWKTALRRYNGRRDRTDTNRYYSEEYAEKIIKRSSDPETFVPIEIKLVKYEK